MIRETKPDLVALQEVDVGVSRSSRVHEARELGRLTDMAVRFGPTQHFQGGFTAMRSCRDCRLKMCIYSLFPTVTVMRKERLILEVQSLSKFDLPMMKSFSSISTHFQHNVEGSRSGSKSHLRIFRRGREVAERTRWRYERVTQFGANRYLGEMLAAHSKCSLCTHCSFNQARTRIDYIFYQPQTGLKLVESSVIDEPIASDHLPVLAVFDY